MNGSNFYTFHGYMKKEDNELTASMEDYIEMIYRLSENGFTRISELSQALNVQPSSATKMVQRLAEMGYIKYEKYGYLMLEEKGREIGAWLYKRHVTLENFLRMIGVEEDVILQETEKMEHMLSEATAEHMENLVTFLKNSPDVMQRYAKFETERL